MVMIVEASTKLFAFLVFCILLLASGSAVASVSSTLLFCVPLLVLEPRIGSDGLYLTGLSVEDVARQTTANAVKLFGLESHLEG